MTIIVAIIQTAIFCGLFTYWIRRIERENQEVVRAAEELLDYNRKHIFNLIARMEILEKRLDK